MSGPEEPWTPGLRRPDGFALVAQDAALYVVQVTAKDATS